jgi:molybdopterin-guanine dinucleotide biosynthesis protein MobB
MGETPLIGIAAPGSGQGKTRLILALLQEFAERGLRVAVLKHGQHVSWPADKDSGLYMRQGAAAALLVTPTGWLLAAQTPAEPDFDAAARLLKQSGAADLVLVEGYKQGPQPKLLLARATLSAAELLPHTVALISEAPQHLPLPCFRGAATEAIAGFIISYCKIGG